MKKKLLSCLMAGVLAVQGFGGSVSAAGTGSIRVGSATVQTGTQFELPVEIESNPGIAGLSLLLTYDAEKLELLSAIDGKILGTSSYLAGKDLTMIPYTMNWDDLSASNNTGTGTVAVLSFRAKEDAAGSTTVSVAVNQKSTYNVDMQDVAFTVQDGLVTFSDEPVETSAKTTTTTLATTTTASTTTVTTTTPAPTTTYITSTTVSTSGTKDETTVAPSGAAIIVDRVPGLPTENVSVPIRIQNNPGITGLSLNISYDDEKLMLLGAADGKILGSSTFLSGKDISAMPYTLNWDDLGKYDNTGDGVVATLVFLVLDDAEGTAEVSVAVNQKSTYNAKMQEVAFAVQNGAVIISDSASGTGKTTTTTATTSTSGTVKTTTTTVSTSTSGTVKTTTATGSTSTSGTVKTTTTTATTSTSGTVKTTTATVSTSASGTVKTTTATGSTSTSGMGKTTTTTVSTSMSGTGKTTTTTVSTSTSGTVKTTTTTGSTSTSGTGKTTTTTGSTSTSGTGNTATTSAGTATSGTGSTETGSIPADAAAIIADTVSAKSGETVEVSLRIQNNPGIAALSVKISYDNTKLKLLGAKDCKILGSSTFLAGNDLTLIPYTLNWDDLAEENNTGNGAVAVLSFEVLPDASGTAAVEVALNQPSTFNVDLDEVAFATGNGAVEISGSGVTGTSATGSTDTATETTTTTTQPVGPAIIGGTVTAAKGDTVELPIRLYNNPGIAALSLNISYDNTQLKLLGAQDGKILGTSTFLAGNDLTLIPYTLNWDDLADENNTGNGVVAKLKFEVLASEGQALVEIALNQPSTFNVDLDEVAFATGSGKVKIGSSSPDFLLGDVNLDGTVSVEDAQLTLTAYVNIMADMDSGLSDIQKRAADVNADGEISVDDAQNILLYYVKNTLTGTPVTWEELLGK